MFNIGIIYNFLFFNIGIIKTCSILEKFKVFNIGMIHFKINLNVH